MDPVAPIELPRLLAVSVGAERELQVAVIDEVAHAVEPRHPHECRRRVGDAPEALLAFANGALRDALLGDVVENDADAFSPRSTRSDPRHIIDLERELAAFRMVKGRCEILALS